MAEIIKFKPRLETSSPKLEEPVVDLHVEMVTDAILSAALDSLIKLGYDLENNFDIILPSIVLLKETITSLQLKINGEYHFLQEVAENSFTIVNE